MRSCQHARRADIGKALPIQCATAAEKGSLKSSLRGCSLHLEALVLKQLKQAARAFQ